MKNKGFTLIELLAVIVILGILLTIAIPSVLKVSKAVKEKSYVTKIEMIESSAVVYGQTNSRNYLNSMTTETSINYDGVLHGWLYIDSEDNVKTIGLKDVNGKYKYPYERISLEELASNGGIKYDDETDKKIVNPVTDNPINSCYVYIYLKNNRIYAHFDKSGCDKYEEDTYLN